jgi:peptidoglycan hydrolase-like protein with peptidoglycan-binding domain
MFTTYPTYSVYRTLRLLDPRMRGEDVYALQTALVALGWDVDTDGVLGPLTSAAIKNAQGDLRIVVDGLCGGNTQTAMTQDLANREQAKHDLPHGLVFGQCMHESSCRLGAYCPQREDGSYDVGVAQRNTNFTSPKDGFNAPASVEKLGGNSRQYYDKFVGVADVTRRWELAAGAWNAPAFANWIARQEGATSVPLSDCRKPGINARATLEEYMASVTAFMVL